MAIFRAPQFHDERAACRFVEAHLRPDGPVCPHCGATDRIYELKGESTRFGTRKCGHRRKPFTATVGTVFEASHIPLHKWLTALYLLCSGKEGISTHRLHRTLGVTVRTAWFMAHRIRGAMRDGSLAPLGGSGGSGGSVEADEAYYGERADPAPSAAGPAGAARPARPAGARWPGWSSAAAGCARSTWRGPTGTRSRASCVRTSPARRR